MRKLLYIFFLCTCCCIAANGQQRENKKAVSFPELEFTPLIKNPNMLPAYISIIERDQRGVLWLGTQMGLYRVQGQALPSYNNQLAKAGVNQIMRMIAPWSDALWIGSDAGIVQFNTATGKINYQKQSSPIDLYREVIKSDSAHILFQENDSTYIIRSINGIERKARFNRSAVFPLSKASNGWVHQNLNFAAVVDQDGQLWSWMGNYVYQLNKSYNAVEQKIELPTDEADGIITCVYFDKQQQCWIGTWSNGWFIYNFKTRTFTRKALKTNNRIHQMKPYIDKKGKEWIAATTGEGLVLADPVTLEHKVYPGTQGMAPTSLKIDDEHIIWYSNADNIFYAPPPTNAVRQYNIELPVTKLTSVDDSLYLPEYISIIGHKIFAGFYYNKGMGIYEDSTLRMIGKQTQIGNDKHTAIGRNFNDVLLDPYGQYWIAADGKFALCSEHLKPLQFYEPDSIGRYSRRGRLYRSMQMINDSIMLLMSAGALYSFDVVSKKFQKDYYSPAILKEQNIPQPATALYNFWYDAKLHTIWLLNESFFFKIDVPSGSIKDISHSTKTFYYGLMEDKNGTLWLGTNRGLMSYDKTSGAYKEYSSYPGAPTSYVWHLCPDRHDNIWMTTNIGIACWDKQKQRFIVVNKYNGLPGNYTEGGIRRLADGRLIAGYDRALVTIAPDYFLDMPYKAIINEVRIQDSIVPINKNAKGEKSIQFPANTDLIHLSFSSAIYRNIHNLRYYYRILDKDSLWHEADNGVVDFINLASGTYRVQVATIGNPSQEEMDEIMIRILPPFYRTWWFVSLSGIAVLLIVGFIARIWLKKKKLQMLVESQRLENERQTAVLNQKMANIELAALRSQMNPHFIFNCLNSIRLYAAKNDSQAATLYLTKFSNLIRLVLENSKSEKVSLAREIGTIQLYLDMEEMRFKEKLHYQIVVDKSIDGEYIELPPMLIQPYVENAIWHGLMHKDKGGEISIHISEKDDTLVISVKDNGIGREKAEALKSRSATAHKSFGMNITNERLQLINKKHNVNAGVQVNDLYEDGIACGTEVIIKIPVL
ncbi:MAG: histidine kinase [Niabella sp.]